MKMRKRIEALELAVKQSSCDHSYDCIGLSEIRGVSVRVTATCWKCEYQVSRYLSGEKIKAAKELLLKEVTKRT